MILKVLYLALSVFLLSCNGVTTDLNPLAFTDDPRTDGPSEPQLPPDNFPPSISEMSDQTINEDESISELEFSIEDDQSQLDCETSVDILSTNETLLPPSSIQLSGGASKCLLSITPEPNENGVGFISVIVTDGELASTKTFMVYVAEKNDLPEILNLSDGEIIFGEEDELTLNFEIQDIDSTIRCTSKYITFMSDNVTMINIHQMALSGTSTNCVLKLRPTKPGVSKITVFLDDGDDYVSKDFYLTSKLKNFTDLLGSTEVGNTVVKGITQDSDFNYYVAGETNKTLGDENPMIGDKDGFLIKYDKNFEKKWVINFGVNNKDTVAESLAIDSDGSVIVVGYTDGALHGESLNGEVDGFIIKYNKNGLREWTRLLGKSEGSTEIYEVKIDIDKSIYVTGVATNGLNDLSPIGPSDGFVVKYNTNGSQKFARIFGEEGTNVNPTSLALDSGKNIYIAGHTDGSFDGQEINGNRDGFVTKFTKLGNQTWTRLYGAITGDTNINDIEIDENGKIYIAGETDVGLNENSVTGDTDAFVGKLFSSGTIIWLNQIGGTGKDTTANSVKLDPDDNVYITGHTTANLDGNGTRGDVDVFLQKYTSEGVASSLEIRGGLSSEYEAEDMVINELGNILIVGRKNSNIEGYEEIEMYDGLFSTFFSYSIVDE